MKLPSSFILAAFLPATAARLTAASANFNDQAAAVEKITGSAPQIMHEEQSEPEFDDTPSYDIFDVQSSLDAHRNIWWQTVGDGNNYDMKFERVCFCPDNYRGPFELAVRGGAVTTATYTDGTAVDSEMLGMLLTVEGVMDEIQKGLDRKYVELKVKYNNMGYPDEFYSDSSRMIADDEMTYKISDVVLVDE